MKRKLFLRYSFLAGGFAFLKTSKLHALYRHSRKYFLNKVKFFWAGGITTNSVTVKAKLTTATSTARLVVSTDPSLSNPLYGSFAAADATNNLVAQLAVSGLAAGTTYYYGIEADGIIDTAVDAIGRFKTFANGPHSFRFSAASCNNNGNHPVFYRIKEKDPLFHITHGDFHYADPNSATDRNVHRQPFENTLAQPAMKEFLRNHAIAYMWDDHDYCGDNTNSFAVGRTNARLTVQEYVPHYPLPAGSGDVPIYQSYTVGRVKFILSDLRSEKGVTGTSMMGAAQKAWFKNECLSAKNNGQAIVWISTVPWGGTVAVDTWAGFTDERTELSDFFKAAGIQNLLVICGDAHMIAMDDGTNHDFSTGGNNPFKYPVLQAAAVNQVGSFRGGVYSEGFFTNPSQQHGQYAVVDINDNGGSNIGVNITGYRVEPDRTESVLLTYSFNWAVLSVLPIRIYDFSVAAAGDMRRAVLTWKTERTGAAACQQMIVERSRDGSLFVPIGTEDCSSSASSDSRHSFIDEAPLNGKNYYRIQLVDQEGKVHYSQIEAMQLTSGVTVDLAENPVKEQLKLIVRTPSAEAAHYTIADANGRALVKSGLQLTAGRSSISIPIPGFNSGVYFLSLVVNEVPITKRFVVQ